MLDDTIAKLPDAIKRQQDARYHSQGRLKKMAPNDALFRLAEEAGVKEAKQHVGSRLLQVKRAPRKRRPF